MQEKPKEQANFIGAGITILILIALVFFVDIESLQTWVERAGVWGPVVFILLKISTIVIAPLSGSPLYPLVGLLFGFWPGILYVALGDFLGYTIAFYLARLFGRSFVQKLISGKEESLIARIVDHISDTKGFFQACLTFFGLPEVLSYGAGLSQLSYIKFISILWPIFTTITVLLVFFGSVLEPKNGSLFIGFVIPVIGSLGLLIGGYFFMNSLKKKEKLKE